MQKKSQPIPDPTEEPFVGVDQTAAVLGVGQSTVYSLVRSGELDSVRVGRLIRIPTSELYRLAGRTTDA